MKHLTIFFLALLFIAGCTSSYRSAGISADSPLNPASTGSGFKLFSKAERSMPTPDSPRDKTSDEFERIMIYNASVSLDTKLEGDTLMARVSEIAKSLNGYILSSGNKYISFRVPAHLLNNAIDNLSAFGEITDKYISGQDVSEQYYDSKIRLENAENTRKRYLELLAKAEDVETMLKIEKELERINGIIESLKGQINRISHLKEFSTISIYYKEPTRPGPLGYIFVGLYEGIKWLFVW